MYVVVTETGSFTVNKFDEIKSLLLSTGDKLADIFYTNGKFIKQVSA